MLSFLLRNLGEREAFYGTKRFNFDQKLLHSEDRNFGRISYKKCRKFGFLNSLDKLKLVCQSLFNYAEIYTSPLLYLDKNSAFDSVSLESIK